MDTQSAQQFGRKRSLNPNNSNRVVKEPIVEDDEGSGNLNSLELGITGQGPRNMRI